MISSLFYVFYDRALNVLTYRGPYLQQRRSPMANDHGRVDKVEMPWNEANEANEAHSCGLGIQAVTASSHKETER